MPRADARYEKGGPGCRCLSLRPCDSRRDRRCVAKSPVEGVRPAHRQDRGSWAAAGRPGRFGCAHLRLISPRCQASNVPGVTSRWAQHGWQQPGQRRQDRPVSPVRLRPGDLTPQHHDLVTERHDFRILRRLASAQTATWAPRHAVRVCTSSVRAGVSSRDGNACARPLLPPPGGGYLRISAVTRPGRPWYTPGGRSRVLLAGPPGAARQTDVMVPGCLVHQPGRSFSEWRGAQAHHAAAWL